MYAELSLLNNAALSLISIDHKFNLNALTHEDEIQILKH
jgi:hypothetical protein